MKKMIACLAAVATVMTACMNDDQYTIDDFRDLTSTDTVSISLDYNGDTVSITGDDYGFVSKHGAHVTVNSTTNRFLQLTLSGSTTNGSLLIYAVKKLGVVLSGVSLHNPQGPAINNQCGKSFIVTTAAGTTNTLSDGNTYTDAAIDQKGTLFSEGQIYFRGTGTLTVSGSAKNGIASDDYIVFQEGTVHVGVSTTGTNGVKVKDGLTISGGTLTINVKADGARGIKNDARTTITGGTTTITTEGDCLLETVDGITDTTSCAGIKCDSLFSMSGGTLTISSTGDGGKGINCLQNIEQSGGTLTVTTQGDKLLGKPKAVKSSTAIIVSGGTFAASCRKSWACDNNTDSDNPAERVTIVGAPKSTPTLLQRQVYIEF